MRKIFALLCFSLGIALVNLTYSVAQAPNLPSVPVPNNPKQLPPQQPPSVEEQIILGLVSGGHSLKMANCPEKK